MAVWNQRWGCAQGDPCSEHEFCDKTSCQWKEPDYIVSDDFFPPYPLGSPNIEKKTDVIGAAKIEWPRFVKQARLYWYPWAKRFIHYYSPEHVQLMENALEASEQLRTQGTLTPENIREYHLALDALEMYREIHKEDKEKFK